MMGRIDALLPLRWWWLIPIAVLLQLGALAGVRTNEELRWLKVALLLGALVLTLAPVWANRHRWGARLVGLGIVLNLLAMVANGGLMPVSPEAREASGRQAAAPVKELGRMVPKSKGVLLAPEDTRLYLLTDIIVVGPPINKSVSIGDIIIVAGIIVLSGEFAIEGWRQRRGARVARPEEVRT